MIPSVLSNQVQRGVEDFLRTTFPVSTPFFHGVMERLLGEGSGIFKGPYISIRGHAIGAGDFFQCFNGGVCFAGGVPAAGKLETMF
jgi:hypothetical protein